MRPWLFFTRPVRFQNRQICLLLERGPLGIAFVAEYIFVIRRDRDLVIVRTVDLLPNEGRVEVSTPEHFVHDDLEVVPLIVVDGHPDRAILGQKIAEQFQPGPHHGEPLRVLKVVVVVLEGGARVVGRIDIDAFHPTGIEGQQRFQRLQVVALDQYVARATVARRQIRNFFQQAIGHVLCRADVLVPCQPVQYRHALPLVLSFLAGGFNGRAGQPLVFFDRKNDDYRAPMLLDHHGLGPRLVDQLAEAMLGLTGRHGLHGPLPDLWSEWSQHTSEVNEQRARTRQIRVGYRWRHTRTEPVSESITAQ